MNRLTKIVNNKHFGRIIIVLSGIMFTISILMLFRKENKKTIDQINRNSEQRKKEIQEDLRASEKITDSLKFELRSLKFDIRQHDKNLEIFQDSYIKSHNELKNLQQNEKAYIPDATYDEQLDFISKYKYKPISNP